MISLTEQACQIARAGWRDLNGIHALEKACFSRDAYPYLELLGLLSLPGFICYKAEMAGEMIGFVAGEKRGIRGPGWVVTVGVVPGYRRQGIAQRLIAVCEEGMGRAHVRLCVRESNQPAIQLYMGVGYQIIKTWRRYYNDGEDALVMEKQR